jgi:hypothetical protein
LQPQVLRKISDDEALVLLIAPVWTTQSWFPLLLQLVIDRPILLPKNETPASQQRSPSLEGQPGFVANFLSEGFADGKSYSTVNTYRSALSSTLHPINHTTIGTHPLVVRILKRIYNLRTPDPRYSTTWDVAKVTSYLKTLFPLDQLNLKNLTLKL